MMDETTWMNAKKAIELGFADGILTDEKVAADVAAFSFSSKAVEMALVGKLTAKVQPEETNKPAGRSVEELKKRLADIKQFI